MKINRYSLKGVSYLSNDFDEYEMCLDNDGDYVKFDDCDILEESDRQKLAMFDEMFELLLHLYVNYELPYGMMDIETKSKFKNTIERAKKIQEEGELWI